MGASPFSLLAVAALVAGGGSHGSYVRVNQVGYPADASKRAYLLADVAETGASFSVRDSSGRVVYSARLGRDLGRWSSAYPHVYGLDFDRVQPAGAYSITVAGPSPGASPRFTIDSGSRLYARPIANARIPGSACA